jgi:8-hydroxy-5-deazaflavin:NADPH oxidoreductase
MKVAIIGSGIVGQTLGKKLVELGHDVVLGTRDPNKLDEAKGWAGSLNDWLNAVGNKATVATFAAAAARGEIIINATHGIASLAALQIAGTENLQGKILIDVANELDLGDITSARGTEMMMPLWLRAFGKLGNVPYNFKIVVG